MKKLTWSDLLSFSVIQTLITVTHSTHFRSIFHIVVSLCYIVHSQMINVCYLISVPHISGVSCAPCNQISLTPAHRSCSTCPEPVAFKTQMQNCRSFKCIMACFTLSVAKQQKLVYQHTVMCIVNHLKSRSNLNGCRVNASSLPADGAIYIQDGAIYSRLRETWPAHARSVACQLRSQLGENIVQFIPDENLHLIWKGEANHKLFS